MRNLKKFLALVLAMVMAFSLMVTANAASDNVTYPDGDSVTEEFKEAVTVLGGMGIMTGDNGSFYPERTIMRSEMAAILYRLMTGDTNQLRDQLYADLAVRHFKDVKSTDWFAPYIGWCYDIGVMKGYNGYVYPWDPVNGYQTLIMVLRAMGYGKNGEYTGSESYVNASSDGTTVGLLADVNNTHYNNTLNQSTRREVVASIVFQAAQRPTVRYELGYYNPYVGVAIGTGNNIPNPSLGEKNFGLTKQTGIVVGNQATGEDWTRVGVDATGVFDDAATPVLTGVTLGQGGNYLYASTSTGITKAAPTGNVTLDYNFGTGLDYFGHKVNVWYDSRTSNGTENFSDGTTTLKVSSDYNRTYAIIDKAVKTAYVYSEDAVMSVASPDGTNDLLALSASAAGFSVQPDAGKGNASQPHFSDRYCQMGGAAANGSANISPISTYALVSNNGSKTVDVVIALSAEVARITQKNTTASSPYLVLGSNTANTSTFGDGATAGKILLSQLTPDTKEEQKAIDATVTAYEIVGTSKTLTAAASIATNGDADALYQLDPMKAKTATVATYTGTASALDGTNPHVTEVNFTDGTSMKLSGITRGDNTNSQIISTAVPVVGSLVANTRYTVFEDIVGRFISMLPASGYKFLYGTYADFEVGGLGTGTITYNMVGVDWDGEKQPVNTLQSIAATAIDGDQYNTLTTTRKDYGTDATTPGTLGGNQILPGYDTGYMYNSGTGDIRTTGLGATKLTDGVTWTVTSTDASNGFAKVNNAADGSSGTNYLLTKNTHFIVVTGTGTATLKVAEFTGLTDFLQGATSADIAKVAWSDAAPDGNMNEVIFRTSDQKYGTVNTAENGVITDIILSDGNLTRWNTETLFYNFNDSADTGMVLPGENPANVKQYRLWNNGQVGYYFVDSTAANGVAPTTTDSFYTLAKIRETNGIPVYKAVSKTAEANLAYADGFNTGVDYEYITVSNLETGEFEKGTGKLVFDITNAKVCDVQYKTVPATAGTRSEITNITELNNAVSVKNVNPATPVYGTVTVAIVYNSADMATIYVTNVA